ncbi:MAG: efflux RND transporter periplasmic adaptor subunit [Planctomycetota bacterium]|nr:efflux RND transporter periplasmic adaptor subunit [Planctomycetota bacterium]
MRGFVTFLLVIAGLGGVGAGIYFPTAAYIRKQNEPAYRSKPVVSGDIVLYVNSTGNVEPVLRVTVGAVVSGPIQELYVDFNEKVKKDQLMAKIDPRLFESVVLRDRATLETRNAEVLRAEARLQQAINSEERAKKLVKKNASLISDTEVDEMRFSRMAAEAELSVAKTAVQQAQASLDNSEANLGYTEIRSPVDGVVIDRKIDEGQTLAAQFQTPELFIVAPEMGHRMFIYASVDEADIGLIRQAKETQNPVTFTVDAYPGEIFENGIIREVRLSSTEESNVVTYPVVVETPNEEMKLLPGMTASLSFQVEEKNSIVKIPNAALRFYPPNRKHVHPDDHKILDGVEEANEQSTDQEAADRSAQERAEASINGKKRHVWVFDGKLLRARAIEVGISDSRYTELISGELKDGDELVVGEEKKK